MLVGLMAGWSGAQEIAMTHMTCVELEQLLAEAPARVTSEGRLDEIRTRYQTQCPASTTVAFEGLAELRPTPSARTPLPALALAELSAVERPSVQPDAGFFDGQGTSISAGVVFGPMSGGGLEVGVGRIKLGKFAEINLSPGYYAAHGRGRDVLSSQVLSSNSEDAVLHHQWRTETSRGHTRVRITPPTGPWFYRDEDFVEKRLVPDSSRNVSLTDSVAREQVAQIQRNLSLITVGNVLATIKPFGTKVFAGVGLAYRKYQETRTAHDMTIARDQRVETRTTKELVYERDYEHNASLEDETDYDSITRDSVVTDERVLSDAVTRVESKNVSGFVPTLTAGGSWALTGSLGLALKVFHVLAPDPESRITALTFGIIKTW
jgi:hypothetical protein